MSEGPDNGAIHELFRSLDPPPHVCAQVEEAIFSRLAAPKPRSLAAEWFDLFRLRPVSSSVLALGGAAALVLLSPFSSVLLSVFQ